MLLGEHCDHIGSDLVSHIAVGGDTICADDNCIDLANSHHRAGHVV